MEIWNASEKQFSSNPIIMSEIGRKIGMTLIEEGKLMQGASKLRELRKNCSDFGLSMCVVDVSRILEESGTERALIPSL